jgi:leader peptidase (prepilin peptidase)/N-methyltransferase
VDALSLWLSPPVLGLLGLCIGSFLNVVAHRLPRMMEREWWSEFAEQLADGEGYRRAFDAEPPKAMGSTAGELQKKLEGLASYGLARPRSACPACGHQIRWYENVPVISWLWLRGRCSACKTPISKRYPLIELGTGLLFALAGWKFGAHPQTLLWCGAIATLIALAVIDLDTYLLPDDLTVPLIGVGLFAAAMRWTVPLSQSVWGLLVGYFSLWAIAELFKRVRGQIGMGIGDFKLLGALGAWLGVQALLPIVLMSSIIGAVAGIAMKFRNSLNKAGHVPFGPFLAGAGIIVMLVGTDRVLEWIGIRF